MTFDDWTGKNRICLTVNVHTPNADFINLGMIRVWGSQKAETILQLVIKRIEHFGLAMEDIVAFVTDGASVMLKLGRLALCEHIVCLSHT